MSDKKFELTKEQLAQVAGGAETYYCYVIRCTDCGELLPLGGQSTEFTLEKAQENAAEWSSKRGCPHCSAAPREGLFEPFLYELPFKV